MFVQKIHFPLKILSEELNILKDSRKKKNIN